MFDPPATRSPSLGASAILFLCFLVICFGLGYPAVSRYDPGKVGNYDAKLYCEMVRGQQVGAPAGFRVLTPTIARGVFALLKPFDFGTWDRVRLSLLVVNAVFASLSAVLLMRIAVSIGQDITTAALVPLIYLSSFAVVNFHLAGLVDAGEGFFLIALLLVLLHDRWWLAPILIGIGATAKETVVPFGLCAMILWWAVARARGTSLPRSAAVAIPVSLLTGLGSIVSCRYLVDVPEYAAQEFSWDPLTQLIPHAIDCLFTRTQLYVYAFLLPMAIPRLGRIPAALLAASGGMAMLALLLGAYAVIGDNFHRPLFNTFGPVLVISCSIFICDLLRGRRK